MTDGDCKFLSVFTSDEVILYLLILQSPVNTEWKMDKIGQKAKI